MHWFFWIIIGSIILGVCSIKNGSQKQSAGRRNDTVRVCRPHYYDADDYECSVCGKRFRKNTMICPNCEARFTRTETDESEYEEEMVEEEDWDEENGW